MMKSNSRTCNLFIIFKTPEYNFRPHLSANFAASKHSATRCELSSMRAVCKLCFHIVFNVVSLHSQTALLAICSCLHWFCCMRISHGDCFTNDVKLNDDSPESVIIYYNGTFTQSQTFYSLWNSAKISKRFEKCINHKQCVVFCLMQPCHVLERHHQFCVHSFSLFIFVRLSDLVLFSE